MTAHSPDLRRPLMVMLNKAERAALERVADKMKCNLSEAVRRLVLREGAK